LLSFGELTLGLMDQARMSRRQGRGPRFLCPLDWFPTFPQTGKYKRRMVLHSDCIEYLAAADLFPFVETVGGVSFVSTRALFVFYAIFGSFAPVRNNPQILSSNALTKQLLKSNL
jgi:hypothetical protein